MLTIRCHFDGKVLIPEEPIELPEGEPLVAHVERSAKPETRPQSSLQWLFDHAVDDPSAPEDLTYQHDHYLYGLPKKP